MSRSWWKNRNSGMMKMTGGTIRLNSSQPPGSAAEEPAAGEGVAGWHAEERASRPSSAP